MNDIPGQDITDVEVSVVIAVHNGMPELTQSVTSALQQSLDPRRVQIIVVDDGSDDGTAAELQRLQEQSNGRLELISQPASGGPGRPRNVGLDRAAGRYVFFLDADDYLGDEALERLVGMADRTGADVVLGKIVSASDGTSAAVFKRDLDNADPSSSGVMWTLSAQKLFRREMLERPPRIRFPEDFWTGEDAYFTVQSYLRAERISVLASYDCYYKVRRPGGGHVTSRPGVEPRFRATKAIMELIGTTLEPGPRRDAVMMRPVHSILRWFHPSFDAAQRREAVTLFGPLIREWVTGDILARLKVVDRLKLYVVAQDRPDLLEELLTWLEEGHEPETVVDDRRQYEVYPFFRDRRIDVPDSVYQIDGPPQFQHTVTALERCGPASVRLRGVATVPETSGSFRLDLVVVGRERHTEHRQPIVTHPDLGTNGSGIGRDRRIEYVVDVNLAKILRNAPRERVWEFFLEVDVAGAVTRRRLGRRGSLLTAAPDPWFIARRTNRGIPAGERIALAFTQHGALTARTSPVPLSLVAAQRLLYRTPLPARAGQELAQRVTERADPATLGAHGWRRLLRRTLTRLNIHVLSPRSKTYVVTRRRDLVTRLTPGGGFFVGPDHQKIELRRLDKTSYLAWQNAKVEELRPDQMLVSAASAQRHRVIPLVAGASLIASRDAEQGRWLEYERALLNYASAQHILGVLKTYDINCVLDVGANRGQYGRLLRRGGYRGHIVSFEPVPGVAEDLRRLAERDAKWSVHAIALGREEGEITMQTVPDQATLSSVLSPSKFGMNRYQSMTNVVPHQVPVRRLDALLDSITEAIPDPRLYLKLDTQGFDLEVFRGLGDRVGDIIALQSEVALMEIYEGMPRMPQAIAIYEDAGFEVSGLFPVSREFTTTRVLEYDCILVRASAVPG